MAGWWLRVLSDYAGRAGNQRESIAERLRAVLTVPIVATIQCDMAINTHKHNSFFTHTPSHNHTPSPSITYTQTGGHLL